MRRGVVSCMDVNSQMLGAKTGSMPKIIWNEEIDRD